MEVIMVQDALQATEALRGDPLLYVLVSFMGAAVLSLGGVVMYLFKRNNQLQDTNTELAKAGTEAIAAFTPLMQSMQGQQRESMQRIEGKINEAQSTIKEHINLLQRING